MVGLATTRKLLGSKAAHFTDKEVERIRQTADGLADAMFENWLRKRNAQAYASEKAPEPP